MGRVVALGMMVALVLQMEDARGCRLDRAQVDTVPPDTFQVLATLTCGWTKTLCWERYTLVGDKRIDSGWACENEATPPKLETKP